MADDLTEGLTPGGEPPSRPPPTARAEPPPEDSTPTFVRNTIVMSTGTAISRLTGFLRLSAMAFAIGITETRLADAYNVANITPNILYELALGGILTSVVVPVVVEWMQSRGRDAAWDVVRRLFTIAIVVLSAIAILGIVLAPWIVDLYTVGLPRRPARGRARPRHVLPALVHAAGRLLRDRRRRRRPAERPSAVRRADVRPDRQQPDRHRDVPDLRRDRPGTSNPKELATGAQQLVLAIGTTLGVVAMTVALWPSVRATGFRFRWIGGDPRRGDRRGSAAWRRGWSSTWSRTSSGTS